MGGGNEKTLKNELIKGKTNDLDILIGEIDDLKSIFLKMDNTKREFLLLIGITKDKNIIVFRLYELYSTNNYFGNFYSLDELYEQGNYFKKFTSINNCINNILLYIQNQKPKLFQQSSDYLTIDFLSSFNVKNFNLYLIKNSNKQHLDLLWGYIKKLSENIIKLEENLQKQKLNYDEAIKEKEKKNLDLLQELEKLKKKMKEIKGISEEPTLNKYIEHKIFDIDSQIISKKEEYLLLINKLIQFEPNKIIKYNLLYRATRDGGESEIFHKKCSDIKSTIVLIETKKGIKFGGFTNETWDGENISKYDDYAFCFSFSLNKIYNIKRGKHAIKCLRDCGPYFSGNGINPTFAVQDNCLNKGGWCCSGSESNYKNYKNNYEINNGELFFGIKELEVYKIMFE